MLVVKLKSRRFGPYSPLIKLEKYARVIENPSCRWSQYTCNAAGVDCSDPGSVPDGLAACCEESHKGAIQERAWTSPFWYGPAS